MLTKKFTRYAILDGQYSKEQKGLWFMSVTAKGSIETTQEVEIYFNFIGKYLPPHFGEVEMTPEEIEEMKKREARKGQTSSELLEKESKWQAAEKSCWIG